MRSTLLNLEKPAAALGIWRLDPGITFLNHGSFGACPKAVLDFQTALRARMEKEPIQFFVRDLEEMLDAARAALALYVGSEPQDLVFVPNATAGVNTVLRSVTFSKGDQLLVTNQEYNACRNALNFCAERWGLETVVAEVPFPLRSEEEAEVAVRECWTPRTKLVLLDHVTSQTGLVMPLDRLAPWFAERGVEVLVDGAHAPGMIPLNLSALGATYYTGNCHKWICAPKGAAFLWVQRDRQKKIRPLSISHGANSPREDRSRFLIEFGWTGTWDPSAQLSVPKALEYMGSLVPGGWPMIQSRNRSLALAGRRLLCEALHVSTPAPESMIGALASVPLPKAREVEPPKTPLYADPLQEALRFQCRVEAPVVPWPAPPERLIRISAQLYNQLSDYEKLGASLKKLLAA